MKTITLDNAATIGVVFDGVPLSEAGVGEDVGLDVRRSKVGRPGTRVSLLNMDVGVPSVVGATDANTPIPGAAVGTGLLVGAAWSRMLASIPHTPFVDTASRTWGLDPLEAMALVR